MMLTFGKRCNHVIKIDSYFVMVNKIKFKKCKMEEIKMKWSNMILAGFGFGIVCAIGLKCIKQYKEHEKEHEKIINQLEKDTKEIIDSIERLKELNEAEDKRIEETKAFIRKIEEESGISISNREEEK